MYGVPHGSSRAVEELQPRDVDGSPAGKEPQEDFPQKSSVVLALTWARNGGPYGGTLSREARVELRAFGTRTAEWER